MEDERTIWEKIKSGLVLGCGIAITYGIINYCITGPDIIIIEYVPKAVASAARQEAMEDYALGQKSEGRLWTFYDYNNDKKIDETQVAYGPFNHFKWIGQDADKVYKNLEVRCKSYKESYKKDKHSYSGNCD